MAKEGNRNALEALIRRIQDGVYGLALRTLFLPDDAEDATQEILIKIITHLGSFRGGSRFTTWCFRVAVLFRSHFDYAAPETFVKSIKKRVESGRLEMFQ